MVHVGGWCEGLHFSLARDVCRLAALSGPRISSQIPITQQHLRRVPTAHHHPPPRSAFTKAAAQVRRGKVVECPAAVSLQSAAALFGTLLLGLVRSRSVGLPASFGATAHTRAHQGLGAQHTPLLPALNGVPTFPLQATQQCSSAATFLQAFAFSVGACH